MTILDIASVCRIRKKYNLNCRDCQCYKEVSERCEKIKSKYGCIPAELCTDRGELSTHFYNIRYNTENKEK